jgi:hypothetical protein
VRFSPPPPIHRRTFFCVPAVEGGDLLRGVEQLLQALRVLLEHVLAHADLLERDPEGLVLVGMPPGTDAAFQPPVGQMIDRGERGGEHARVAVVDAVHEAADAHAPGLQRRRRHRGDRLEAVQIAALRRRFLEVVGDGEPVEAHVVGEFPQPPHVGQRAAHVTDVDAERHRHRVT